MLVAEIIATGSEMLTPDRTDTNSLWLTAELNRIGIEIGQKTIVGDDASRLTEAIRDALRRNALVLTTGGLGPTEDDVTRQSIAAATGRELVRDEQIVRDIEAKFARMGRQMPAINARQAMLLDGAEVLPNPHGSAPGMLLHTETEFIAAMPGPPREMQPMFANYILPRLAERAGGVRVVRRVLRVVGMGESAVDEMIAPIYTQYKNPQTTILFNRSEIEIHLTAQAATETEAAKLLDEVAGQIADKIGKAVFARNGETMEEVVAALLSEQNKTLALAESCTGGLVATRLTELAGASRYLLEGVVAYANAAKTRTLDVSEDLLIRHGAVSAQTAEAMAVGIRNRANADFGISVTGIAGPDGGTEEKPIGLVYIGLADAHGVEHRELRLPGDRHLIRWRSSQAALELLRRRLLANG